MADFTFGQCSCVLAFDGVAAEVAGFTFFAAATSEWIAILGECAAEVYRATFREVDCEITFSLAWAVRVADAGFAAGALFFCLHFQTTHTIRAAVIAVAGFTDDGGANTCASEAPSLEGALLVGVAADLAVGVALCAFRRWFGAISVDVGALVFRCRGPGVHGGCSIGLRRRSFA